MLEKYEKDFDENEFMRSFMERKQISTKKQALAELRKLIKKEGYYQTKIKEALKKRYPDAFVAKISQGAYSQAGIPDVMFIKDGHYFGFEVKRFNFISHAESPHFRPERTGASGTGQPR